MNTKIPTTAHSTSPRARVLLLEDDIDLQELIKDYYTPRGFTITAYSDPLLALKELEACPKPEEIYDLIISDIRMPRMDGLEFTARVKKLAPDLPIIITTAHGGVEVALQAIEAGAYDFVVKPLHFPQLNVSIERALRLRQLQQENQTLRSAVHANSSFEGVIGKSPAIQYVFDLAKRVANSSATVLIHGESGTGKEVVARAIHHFSNRRKAPFIAINCSAIPETLLESELFGHSKGAFTGAADKKIGLFEEAEGGVLFLDEIGDLALSLQAKLLRVLQDRKIKRIGENQFRPIDVRILTATHKDLNQEVREKRFREDLFFRLNVIPIYIPPLRERRQDILALAEHFLKRFSAQNQSQVKGFTPAAIEHLLSLPWRGNVRELENAIERAIVLCSQREIDVIDLPSLETGTFLSEIYSGSPLHYSGNSSGSSSATEISPAQSSQTVMPPMNAVRENPGLRVLSNTPNTGPNFDEDHLRSFTLRFPEGKLPTLDECDMEYIDYILKRTHGVKEQAARILNIDRKTLYRRVKELNQKKLPNEVPSPMDGETAKRASGLKNYQQSS